MKLNNAINKANLIASHSNMRYHIGAVLFDNSKHTTGFNRKFNVSHPTRSKPFSIHAEEMAIIRGLRTNINFPNSTLVVVRVDKHNKLQRSYPCNNCQNLIQKVGIKTIYYIS